MGTKPIRIAMTQPYIPKYRVRLFDLIYEELAASGFEFRVFWGCGSKQRSEIRMRDDSADGPWAEEAETLEFPALPGNPAVFRKVPSLWAEGILVTEMQVTNLNAWAALKGRRPYVTVGHGKSYLGPEPKIAVALESVLNRRARHVCTYTEGGRKEVLARTNLSKSKVTAFNNATATPFSLNRGQVGSENVALFRRNHGIPEGAKVAFYIGALAPYKRIDLLADAFRSVVARSDEWWLIVAGDGPERYLMEKLAEETGRVTLLGNTSGGEATVPASIAQVIVNPGRVGLVAVDALAWKLPILTTLGALHAPEYDYLTVGRTVHLAEPTGEAFANLWLSPREAIVFPTAPSIEDAAHILASTFAEVAVSAAAK